MCVVSVHAGISPFPFPFPFHFPCSHRSLIGCQYPVLGWVCASDGCCTLKQADELHALRQELDSTQEALQRESHRVQLLEAELLRLRCSQSVCLSRRSGGTATASTVTRGGDLPGSGATVSPAAEIREGTGCDFSGGLDDAQLLMGGRPGAASIGTFDGSESYIRSRCAPSLGPLQRC